MSVPAFQVPGTTELIVMAVIVVIFVAAGYLPEILSWLFPRDR